MTSNGTGILFGRLGHPRLVVLHDDLRGFCVLVEVVVTSSGIWTATWTGSSVFSAVG